MIRNNPTEPKTLQNQSLSLLLSGSKDSRVAPDLAKTNIQRNNFLTKQKSEVKQLSCSPNLKTNFELHNTEFVVRFDERELKRKVSGDFYFTTRSLFLFGFRLTRFHDLFFATRINACFVGGLVWTMEIRWD
jgi:hypothetical protein